MQKVSIELVEDFSFRLVRDTGKEKFEKLQRRLQTPTPEKIAKILAEELITILQLRSPRDTGEYAFSWDLKNEGKQVIVFTPFGKLALYLEFGTAPHIIEPKERESLKFMIGNQEVFAKFVNHPGTTAQPHLRAAWEQMKNNIPVLIGKISSLK